MSEENVEIVTALFEMFRNGDHEAVFAHYDEAIEWDRTRSQDHVIELAEVYHGHDGVRTYWRRWLAAWETLDMEVATMIDADDQVVMLVSRRVNRGRSSGIEVEVPPYALLFTMRDRKVSGGPSRTRPSPSKPPSCRSRTGARTEARREALAASRLSARRRGLPLGVPAESGTSETIRPMSLYELLLTLHVVAAIIWLGSGFLITVMLGYLKRAGEAAREGALHGDMEYFAPRLFIPASLSTLIFGVLAGIEGNWDFGQAWIIIGLGGWLTSFLIGFLYFTTESEKIAGIVAEEGPDSPEAARRGARMGLVDKFELTLLFIVAAAMVIKPTGDDTGVLLAFAALLLVPTALGASSVRQGRTAA